MNLSYFLEENSNIANENNQSVCPGSGYAALNDAWKKRTTRFELLSAEVAILAAANLLMRLVLEVFELVKTWRHANMTLQCAQKLWLSRPSSCALSCLCQKLSDTAHTLSSAGLVCFYFFPSCSGWISAFCCLRNFPTREPTLPFLAESIWNTILGAHQTVRAFCGVKMDRDGKLWSLEQAALSCNKFIHIPDAAWITYNPP